MVGALNYTHGAGIHSAKVHHPGTRKPVDGMFKDMNSGSEKVVI
jgi:hypothetical protein